jgi:hypothetical protein
MAKFFHKLAYVSIGGVDLSDHIANFEINETRAELTTTAFGDHGVRRISGLEDTSVTIDFHEDYAATEVHATIYPLIGSTATFNYVPAGTTISASNPLYSGNVLITEWTAGGAIGDLATVTVTWPVDGVVTLATAGTVS